MRRKRLSRDAEHRAEIEWLRAEAEGLEAFANVPEDAEATLSAIAARHDEVRRSIIARAQDRDAAAAELGVLARSLAELDRVTGCTAEDADRLAVRAGELRRMAEAQTQRQAEHAAAAEAMRARGLDPERAAALLERFAGLDAEHTALLRDYPLAVLAQRTAFTAAAQAAHDGRAMLREVVRWRRPRAAIGGLALALGVAAASVAVAGVAPVATLGLLAGGGAAAVIGIVLLVAAAAGRRAAEDHARARIAEAADQTRRAELAANEHRVCVTAVAIALAYDDDAALLADWDEAQHVRDFYAPIETLTQQLEALNQQHASLEGDARMLLARAGGGEPTAERLDAAAAAIRHRLELETGRAAQRQTIERAHAEIERPRRRRRSWSARPKTRSRRRDSSITRARRGRPGSRRSPSARVRPLGGGRSSMRSCRRSSASSSPTGHARRSSPTSSARRRRGWACPPRIAPRPRRFRRGRDRGTHRRDAHEARGPARPALEHRSRDPRHDRALSREAARARRAARDRRARAPACRTVPRCGAARAHDDRACRARDAPPLGRLPERPRRGLLRQVGAQVSRVRFGEDLDFAITTARGTQTSRAKALHQLSAGARDQLHLAVRLAISEFLSRGGERLPLLIDDCFATSDDERARSGMRLLLESFSREHQLVLVTCHRRRYEGPRPAGRRALRRSRALDRAAAGRGARRLAAAAQGAAPCAARRGPWLRTLPDTRGRAGRYNSPPVTHIPSSTHRAPNHLAGEKSPYLLQHLYNPVDWYPWGEAAFDKARREGKPIFLSIGYSTCHWCHVMERESFEDEAVAALLNDRYVPIKVDREERPDVDRVYMTAMQAMRMGGGWPLNVFLTPELQPFYGGTYFPPRTLPGRIGLVDLLVRVSDTWRERRDAMTRQGVVVLDAIGTLLDQSVATATLAATERARLADRCFDMLAQVEDREHGGFGEAPKFPQVSFLTFLFRRYARDPAQNERARDMALRQLDAMRASGIHDQIGGGFHRYATDRTWLVPHFEKMLYDQAQLAWAYLDAFQLTGREAYADDCAWRVRVRRAGPRLARGRVLLGRGRRQRGRGGPVLRVDAAAARRGAAGGSGRAGRLSLGRDGARQLRARRDDPARGAFGRGHREPRRARDRGGARGARDGATHAARGPRAAATPASRRQGARGVERAHDLGVRARRARARRRRAARARGARGDVRVGAAARPGERRAAAPLARRRGGHRGQLDDYAYLALGSSISTARRSTPSGSSAPWRSPTRRSPGSGTRRAAGSTRARPTTPPCRCA
jgi:hypothetical protein